MCSDQGKEYPVSAKIGGTLVKSEAVVGESFTHLIVVNMSLPHVPPELPTASGNWIYFRFIDTLPSSYYLHSVSSQVDKREVLVGKNVWRTSKTWRLVQVGEVPQRYVHILDYAPPSGIYELRFGSVRMVSQLKASIIADTSVMLTWDSLEQGTYFLVYQKIASAGPETYDLLESDIQQTSLSKPLFISSQDSS